MQEEYVGFSRLVMMESVVFVVVGNAVFRS
jgi:hypothetical protein